jgi:hypothetical protein
MDKKVYMIIEGRTLHELVKNVDAKMKKGWVPVGGPFLYDASNRGSPDFYQAMKFYEEWGWEMKRIVAVLLLVVGLALFYSVSKPSKVAVFGRTLFPCPPFCEHALKVADYRGVYHRVTEW